MAPVRKNKPKKVAEPAEAKERTVVSGQLHKKVLKQQQRKAGERGVVLIKHLPHGFFEEQLQKYFQQFGTVTRLRLVRSRRTGGSKGYAFVEFEYPEVARVAADTMDNYLMFQKVVKASYIPPEKQAFNYFKSSVRKVKNKAGKEIYVSTKTAAIERQAQVHNNWSEKAFQKRAAAQLRKIKKLNAKFPDLNIDFSSVVMMPEALSDDLPSTSQKSSNRKGKNQKLGDDTKAEGFIPTPDSDDELQVSSDEEDNSTNETVEETKTRLAKRSKVDRLAKRAGGVQKPAKHAKKPTAESKAKTALKLKAAKEVAKPLGAFKNKKSKASKK